MLNKFCFLFYVHNLLYMHLSLSLVLVLFSKACSLLWSSWLLHYPKMTRYPCLWSAVLLLLTVFHFGILYLMGGSAWSHWNFSPLQLLKARDEPLSVRGHGRPSSMWMESPWLARALFPLSSSSASLLISLQVSAIPKTQYYSTSELKSPSPPTPPHTKVNPPTDFFMSVSDIHIPQSPQAESLGASSSSNLDSAFGSVKLSPYESSQIWLSSPFLPLLLQLSPTFCHSACEIIPNNH